MGVDNDALLVVGWLLPWDDLKRWLLAKGERGCSGRDGDCCGHYDCWVVDGLPAGWCLDSASPYYNCPSVERQHYLSLADVGGCHHVKTNKLGTLAQIQAALARPETAQAAALAREMGAATASPDNVEIWALPHIW
jgi:hypothetical protein